jgi:hypothetical protein
MITPPLRGRRDAVTAAAKLLVAARALNASRAPDHRESIALAIAMTEDSFRLPNSELPHARADPLLDAVRALQTAAEASPEGYEVACARLDLLLRMEGSA